MAAAVELDYLEPALVDVESSSLRTAAWCVSHLSDTLPRPTASALRTPSTAAASAVCAGAQGITTVGTTEEILGAGVSAEKFTAQSLPSAGALMKENDMPSLFDERPQLRVILVWHYRKRGLSGTHNIAQPPFTSPCAFSRPTHGQNSDLFLRKQTGRYRHLDD